MGTNSPKTTNSTAEMYKTITLYLCTFLFSTQNTLDFMHYGKGQEDVLFVFKRAFVSFLFFELIDPLF